MSATRPQRSGPPRRNGTVSGAEPPPGRGLSFATLLLVAVFAAAATGATAAAGVHRVTCKGIHKLSSTTAESACAESAMLDDAHGRFLPSHSEASADRGHGLLAAAAGGGAIRDVGYGGRHSTSVIIEQLRLDGAWRGKMPIDVTMRLRYRFGGDGESRIMALLRSSAPGVGRGEHQAAVQMRYTGLGGAFVIAGDTKGRFEQPADGRAMRRAEIELRVVQMVDASTPDLRIRADIAVHALPNLGSFEESLTSLVHAQGDIRLSAPCPFRIEAPPHASAWTTSSATADATATNRRERGFRC